MPASTRPAPKHTVGDTTRRLTTKRRRAALGLAVAAAMTLAVGVAVRPGATASAAKVTGGEWTTYGGSNLRESVQTSSPPMRPLRVRWHSAALDGGVYGEPLIFGGHVDVATEADTVYGLSASTGKVLWRRQLGSPVPSGDLPCGDIGPTVGVTSTMVIDPARDELFVSGAVLIGGVVHHEVFALSATTGALIWRVDVDRPGWDAAAQLQRTGLALADGRVIVGFGGNYGDCGQYHGVVIGVPESGKGTVLSYQVPTTREGAVWAPSGVSVSAAGDIYAATGNGASDSAYDEGDSVIELSASLRRVGLFAPTNWAQDNETDGDLGSNSAMLLPGNRALIVGKEITGYLLDATHLGGIGGQLAEAQLCFSAGGDAYLAPLAYVACPQGGLTAVRVGARSLSVAWRGPSGSSGSPTIADGIVFVVANGELYGMAAASGRVLTQTSVIATEHFAAPSAGEGLLVVGGDDAVEAFEGPDGYTP